MEPSPESGERAQMVASLMFLRRTETYQGTGLLVRNEQGSRSELQRQETPTIGSTKRFGVERSAGRGRPQTRNRALPGTESDTNCCRYFLEADGFPGLTGTATNVLVAQVGTVGMEHLRTLSIRCCLRFYLQMARSLMEFTRE